MKISKKGKEYIHAFSTKAARIFEMYGFVFGPPLTEAYIPNVEELEKIAIDNVQELSSTVSSCERGRILAHDSDFEFGFRLFLDLKDLPSNESHESKEVK